MKSNFIVTALLLFLFSSLTLNAQEKNKKDLEEVPQNVKRKITFIPVKNMDEVLPIAMGKDFMKNIADKPLKKKKTANS